MIFPTKTQEMFGLDFSIKFTTAEEKQKMNGPGITLGNLFWITHPTTTLLGALSKRELL